MRPTIAPSAANVIAAVAVLISFVVDVALVSLFGERSPMIGWLLPVIVVALFFGTRVALLTTAVTVAVGVWYLVAPPFGLGAASGPSVDVARLALLSIEGALASWLIGSRTFALRAERRAAAELQEGEARAQSVVENVADGIIAIDDSGRVISFNASAERLFGYERAEVIGQNVKMLMPEACAGKHADYSRSYPARETPAIIGASRGAVGKRKDGTVFAVELAVSEYLYRGQRYFTGIVRDIGERKRSEEILREQKEELETLLDSLPIAVLVAHDATCRSITGNAAAEVLFRSRPGANLSKTAAPEDRPRHFRALRGGREVPAVALPIQRAASGERVDGESLDLAFDDGSVVHTLVYARPLFDAHGQPRGAVSAMQDVTETKRAERELRNMDRRKDEFLAVLAHELRNPLAPLRTGLELLKARRDGDANESVRAMMERQLAHLVRLVDDLIDLSRITRADVPLQRSVFDLSSAVEAALEMEKGRIEDLGHELLVRQTERELLIDGDPDRLTQVFANLLSNAAKYMEGGGRIVVETERKDDEAIVRVADTGFGIPPERLKSVFEMFTQVPEHRSRMGGGGGLGIGLAVAREIVELHGGTIEARSAGLGRGAEFIVRLPLAAPEAASTQSVRPEPAIEQPRRVLVVDDNVDAADALASMLRLKGHAVEATYDGPSALAAVGRLRPEVVLLDLGMPGMDGYEVARRLRASPGGKAIFLCAITGWGQQEDKSRARDAGFDEHLTKPVSAGLIFALMAGRPSVVHQED